MKLGLNAVFLRPKMGGMETYVRALIPEMLRLRPNMRLTLYVNSEGEKLFSGQPWAGDVQFVHSKLFEINGGRALAELLPLSAMIRRADLDLVHSLAMTGPIAPGVPHLLNIPDLIWLRYPRSAESVTTSVWRAIVPPLARRATRVLAISEATKKDVVQFLKVPSQLVDVTPLGFGVNRTSSTDPVELDRKYGLQGRQVILTVSAKRAHKNLVRLLEAFAEVHRSQPDTVLVLPGNPTAHEEELKKRASQLGISTATRFIEYVSPEDLEGLYDRAELFVFTSMCEGFGLPILEAMARDVPVACSDISSLPEVAGKAAAYFDPADVGSIAQSMQSVLGSGDLASSLVAAGRKQIRQFTWEQTALATLQSYDRALGDSSR